MRINRFIASSGISSRRGAEELVRQGKIKVNNKVVTDLSTDINVDNDTVTYEGKKLKATQNFTYVMFYKPKGCVTTASDEKGRKTIYDYIDITDKRLFPVGRLDYDSEGLLLLTNDGDMAFKLTHPSNEVPKTYLVKVEGEVKEADLARLRNGVELDGEKTKRCKIKLREFQNGISSFDMTIYEGKNRQIRRMFETIDKEVIFLKRIAIGEVRLGGLTRGKTRFLNQKEIDFLKKI
ncbi:MAG: pseudouridine synthase [Eubacteriales bacterium]|nr:pseudouridine synthase [Eubacteriales bacterium]